MFAQRDGMPQDKVEDKGPVQNVGEKPFPCLEAQKAMREICNWEGGEGITAYKLNPKVSFIAVGCIWTLIIVALSKPEYALKGMEEAALEWVGEVWSWMYILSQNVRVLSLLYILFIPRFSGMILGREGDKPAYSFATWFSLLFSAGLAVGLFYYGVAEPLWYYKAYGGARWGREIKGYGTSNEDASHAMMIVWYHWGLHGWIAYTTMGAALAITVHRRGFPMSIRYVFYPLIGDRAIGGWGDFIDIFSIVTTICGVSTSLGIGTFALNAGFVRNSHGFYRGTRYNVPANTTLYSDPSCGDQGKRCEQDQIPFGIQTNTETQLIIVACVTCCATASVVSGLNTGIVNLSRITFSLGMAILLLVLFLGEPYHVLNVLCQTWGYYLWYLPSVAWKTDAYELLGDKELGLGGAPDSEKSGSPDWIRNFTLFYWGWWISWAPFVGTFIARISKGRTMRQFIIGTLIIPSLYSFLWMGTFGAEGIRMQRMAESSGLCDIADKGDYSLCQQEGNLRSPNCLNYAASYTREMKERLHLGFDPDCQLDPVYHGGFGRCREFKWERRVEVGNECVETTSWIHMPCNKEPGAFGGPGRCSLGGCHETHPSVPDPTSMAYPPVRGPCKGIIMMAEIDPASSKRTFNWFYGEQPRCFVPMPDNLVCLYNAPTPGDMFFDLIASYGPRGFSDAWATFSIVAMILYFVTSSDSGSYVVDMFASNGDEDPPTTQRIFWSVTEGMCCGALLLSGRNLPDPLGGFKALQCAVLLTGLPYTIILFWVSQSLILLCQEEVGDTDQYRKSFRLFIINFQYPVKLIRNTITPGICMGKIIGHVGGWPFSAQSRACSQMVFTFVFQGFYSLAIGLVCMTGILDQWHIIGMNLYLGVATFMCFLRNNVRQHCGITRGELITDFICAVFAPMFCLTQLEVELFVPKGFEDDEKNEEKEMLTMYGFSREA